MKPISERRYQMAEIAPLRTQLQTAPLRQPLSGLHANAVLAGKCKDRGRIHGFLGIRKVWMTGLVPLKGRTDAGVSPSEGTTGSSLRRDTIYIEVGSIRKPRFLLKGEGCSAPLFSFFLPQGEGLS